MSKPMTLQEIADELGISRQMVYKIEQRALKKASAIIAETGYTLEELLRGDNLSPNRREEDEYLGLETPEPSGETR